MERPHIEAQSDVVAQKRLKLLHETHGVDGRSIQRGRALREDRPVLDNFSEERRVRGEFSPVQTRR